MFLFESKKKWQLVAAAAVCLSVALIGLVIGLAVRLSACVSSRHTVAWNQQSAEMTTVSVRSQATTASNDRRSQFPAASAYRKYRRAAVTTDSAICSTIGTDVLLVSGGSAVDAAIAAQLCIGVVTMQSSGIGGGHFATIYARRRGDENATLFEMSTVTGRERAPAFATRDMFVNRTRSAQFGGLAVGIPGEIRGFYEQWRLYGRLAWSELFQPAIRLCEEGFRVERSLAVVINKFQSVHMNDTNLRELFMKPDGTQLQEGDLLKNVKLGRTMRRIAADPFSFYNGSLADDIVADIAEYGGNITLADLNGYKAATKPALNVTLQNGGYTLYNPPPPASGAILDFIMSIVDGYNFTENNVSSVNRTVSAYHVIVEAFKYAYGKRSQLGDEDFLQPHITQLIANLTSADYAASFRHRIHNGHTHQATHYGIDDHGTSHLNVLAADGSAVALTSTINLEFGAKVRGNRTGILFNNQMDDFSTPGLVNAFGLQPSESNFIAPGKMPQSSMCPTIVLDENGHVVFMAGGVGGSRITTSTAFVMMNSLWFDKDLKSATDTARIHHQLVPNILYYEPSLDSAVVRGLEARRHVTQSVERIAIVNTIRVQCDNVSRSTACIEAVSDGRKGGIPDGL